MKSFIYYMIYAFMFIMLFIPYVFQMHNGFGIFLVLSGVTFILNFISQSFINNRYRNKIKDINEYEYWNEVEFLNIEPIHAGVLLNKGSVNINGIIATIFLLEKKGIFNIDIQGDKYYISLKKIEKTDIDNLKNYEEKIVKFLFKSIDDDRKLDLGEEIKSIKANANKRIAMNEICKEEQQGAYQVFYKKAWEEMTTFQEILFGILTVNSMFGFLIVIAAINTSLIIPVAVSYVIQLVLMMYMLNKKQLYIKYVDEVNRLQGLYNYLKKYSTLNDKEGKYYKLYEKFFLYAVGLGIADKLEKEFNQVSIDSTFITDIKVLSQNNYFTK